MTQASKRKVEFILATAEVGVFFRKLGDAIEQGVLHVGDTSVNLERFQSLGFSVKEEYPGFRVKLKIRYPDSPAPSEGREEVEEDSDAPDDILGQDLDEEFAILATRPRPKYKTLKKRMKERFKAIRLAVDNGVLPGKDVAYAFARDSEVMVAYPDKGAEHYDDYTRLVQEFMVALEDRDFEHVRGCLEALEECKTACHEKYK